MDLTTYLAQFRGQEIVAYGSSCKYRGVLENALEGDYFVLAKVAVVNFVSGETTEFERCVLNMSQISGFAQQEISMMNASGMKM